MIRRSLLDLIRPLFLGAGLALAALLMSPGMAFADSFIVTSADDADDGQCTPAHCSLREAINAANANPGADTISFNLAGPGPFTITLTSPLPAVSDGGTEIDGTSQPGYASAPLVMLQPAYPPPPGPSFIGGITLNSSGNTVRGLSLVGFDFTYGGICAEESDGGGGIVVRSGSGNLIAQNYLGLTPGGAAMGNRNGVYIHEDAPGQTLSGNVISANTECGIAAMGDNQVIQDNLIGTDPSGSSAMGNPEEGVLANSIGNLIGGAGHGNLVSGNGAGIVVNGDPGVNSSNRIEANRIGTDTSGSGPIPNTTGIYLTGKGGSIGSSDPASGNLVAYNAYDGIVVFGESLFVLRNEVHHNGSYGVRINGRVEISRNSIYANGDLGIKATDILFNGPSPAPQLNPYSAGYLTGGGVCQFCVIEVFIADPDPSGAGEGKTFVGIYDSDLNGDFTIELPLGLQSCDRLTATSTDGTHTTSEFAQNVVVTPCLLFQPWHFPLLVLIWPFFLGPLGAVLIGRRRGRPAGSSLLRGGLYGLGMGVLVGAGLWFAPIVQRPVPYAGQPPVPLSYPEPDMQPQETPPTPTLAEPTPTPTSTPTASSTPTPTAELGACTYEALVNLFCRAGSDPRFEAIDSFTPGQTAPVLGEGSQGTHWYVSGPLSGLTCTVPKGEQFGFVTGDCSGLPRFTPMPTPQDTLTPTPTTTPTRPSFTGG